jgi:phospholipase C
VSVRSKRRIPIVAALGALVLAGTTVPAMAHGHDEAVATTTPIKHLVVIFQENVSFDHYFATYPNAANVAGEPRFTAAAATPSVNGLNTPIAAPNNPTATAGTTTRSARS